jgi:glucan phosphoethanolaminetransferase (alkaline phosphatase superfamily)
LWKATAFLSEANKPAWNFPFFVQVKSIALVSAHLLDAMIVSMRAAFLSSFFCRFVRFFLPWVLAGAEKT